MFKWTRDEGDERPVVDMPGLFFAKQTIHNACATQAILSILMNASDIDLGQPLTEFREFVMDFSADVSFESLTSYSILLEQGNCNWQQRSHSKSAQQLLKLQIR